MNPDLLEQLGLLLPRPAVDATATRPAPRPATIGPAPSAASQPRPRPRRGGVAGAVLRSAEPSEDTPGGMLNELLNPLRAGAQAREALDEMVSSARGGDVAGALGGGAMLAMAMPGLPGDDVITAIRRSLPSEMRSIPARLPAPEQAKNFERFYGQSVLRTPEGVPVPVVHGTSATRFVNGQLVSDDFSRFRLPYEGTNQLGIHVSPDPRQAGRFSTYDPSGSTFSMLGALLEAAPTNPQVGAEAIEQAVNSSLRTGGRSMPLWARAENPLRLPDLGRWHPDDIMWAIEERYPDLYRDIRGPNNLWPLDDAGMRRALRERGFDSVVYRNLIEGVPPEVLTELTGSFKGGDWYKDQLIQELWPDATDAYMMLDPRQLKSAIGNVGTYDRRTADLMRALALSLGGGSAAAMGAAPEEEMP